ncbi:MAG: hypothetical protein O3A33_05180 [Chloroflexi bacterium]|nr:hypothetical protein [Chloroflexota bacterium]
MDIFRRQTYEGILPMEDALPEAETLKAFWMGQDMRAFLRARVAAIQEDSPLSK